MVRKLEHNNSLFHGSLTGVIAALVVWCIWTFWEKHPASDVQPSEKLFFFEKNDDSERRSKRFTFEVVVPESLEEPQSSVMDFKFPLSFEWPSFLHRRRQSNNVEEPYYCIYINSLYQKSNIVDSLMPSGEEMPVASFSTSSIMLMIQTIAKFNKYSTVASANESFYCQWNAYYQSFLI